MEALMTPRFWMALPAAFMLAGCAVALPCGEHALVGASKADVIAKAGEPDLVAKSFYGIPGPPVEEHYYLGDRRVVYYRESSGLLYRSRALRDAELPDLERRSAVFKSVSTRFQSGEPAARAIELLGPPDMVTTVEVRDGVEWHRHQAGGAALPESARSMYYKESEVLVSLNKGCIASVTPLSAFEREKLDRDLEELRAAGASR
jgi:hypothetical protein